MAVGPVMLHGVIQRTQDVSMLKQQEDSRPMVEQQQIQSEMKQQESKLLKQVKHADDADEHQKKYDAKEKGSNEYEGRKKKKKGPKEKGGGKVVLRQESGHFDMKI